MADWRELPHLLGPRLQETEERLGAILMRFDNELYLRVEAGGRSLVPFIELRFALLVNAGGAVVTPPMAEAAHHLTGGLGYRFTSVVGSPVPMPPKVRGSPEDEAGLEAVKARLRVKRGTMYLSTAVHPERLEPGAPTWNARAEFTIEGERQGWSKPPDYPALDQRILGVLDDLKQLFLDSVARSTPPRIG